MGLLKKYFRLVQIWNFSIFFILHLLSYLSLYKCLYLKLFNLIFSWLHRINGQISMGCLKSCHWKKWNLFYMFQNHLIIIINYCCSNIFSNLAKLYLTSLYQLFWFVFRLVRNWNIDLYLFLVIFLLYQIHLYQINLCGNIILQKFRSQYHLLKLGWIWYIITRLE